MQKQNTWRFEIWNKHVHMICKYDFDGPVCLCFYIYMYVFKFTRL